MREAFMGADTALMPCVLTDQLPDPPSQHGQNETEKDEEEFAIVPLGTKTPVPKGHIRPCGCIVALIDQRRSRR